MKIIALFIGLAALIVVGSLYFKSGAVPTYQVRVDEIPRVLAGLKASKATPAFAIFMVPQPPSPGHDDKLEVELSIEDGKLGFDWIPPQPQTPEIENRFTDFANAAGYRFTTRESHAVRYLRTEDGDLATLCRDVIVKFYHHSETEPMGLLVEGFDWKN